MSLNGTVWTPIGPSPIDQGAISANGQVTAIAVNPNNANIIFIGTAWGGVWRTRDAGTTWTPLFDRAPSLGIGGPGAIAIDPVNTDVLYVGTSSRNGSQFSGDATQPPAGLFKSTDGGASWIRLGSGYPSSAPSNASLFFTHIINVVLVDPADSQTLVPRLQWRPVRVDRRWLELDPGDGARRRRALDGPGPDVARRCTHLVRRRERRWGGTVHRRWPELDDDPERRHPGGVGEPHRRGFHRIQQSGRRVGAADVASRPAGIQVLYATMVGTGVTFGAADAIGVFQSTDQGGTWTTRATSAVLATIGTTYRGYCLHMAVDPASPGDGLGDVIYFGTLGQGRSTDAGSTFVG